MFDILIAVIVYSVIGYAYIITAIATYQLYGINGIQLHIASLGLAIIYIKLNKKRKGFEITKIK